jgi:rhodanese-related sulfurtransferase
LQVPARKRPSDQAVDERQESALDAVCGHRPLDAQVPIEVAGEGARRAAAVAAAELRRLGYTNVRQYVEGKDGWVAAGLPTEAGPVTAGTAAD